MKKLILSAFSPKMLNGERTIRFRGPINGDAALSLIRERAEDWQPIGIGHPGAASLISQVLRRPVEVDRSPVVLSPGHRGLILLAQGRLDPGAELSDEELKKLLVAYEFEVLE